MQEQIERMAEAIRTAYQPHHSVPLVPWAEVPEHRRVKWREMAAAALESILTAERPETAWAHETRETLHQFVATVPHERPDLPGGQVLVRSFDQWDTAEVCLRPDTWATWSLAIKAERA